MVMMMIAVLIAVNVLAFILYGMDKSRARHHQWSLDEYTDLVCESFQVLPDDIAVHRMTGDGPGDLLIAPDWVRNKKKVLNTITGKLIGKEGHG